MDDNRKRFEARLRLLDECPGVVSRSAGTRAIGPGHASERATESSIRPLRTGVRIAMILGAFLLSKAALAEFVGIEQYDNQVSILANGEAWEPFAALVLQRGPASKWVEPGMAKFMELDPERQRFAMSEWPVFAQTSGETGE